MSRRRSFDIPGHAHELTFCCLDKFPFLSAERTCLWLAESIHRAKRKLAFDLWAFVFMPEHVHMILHPHDAKLRMAKVRAAIKEPIARKAILSICS